MKTIDELKLSLSGDISSELARSAFNLVSHTPEARGDRAQSDYAATMAADYAELLTHANTEEKQVLFEAAFERYRQGYAKRYRAYLASQARCASWFITGPSNFPTRRMEKRNNIAHKRLNEFLEYRKTVLAEIQRDLHPELRPIMAGDSDAVQRLQAKIDAAEKQQERMKQANAIIRKHKSDQTAGKLALQESGFTALMSEELYKPDFAGRIGYAAYELTNNNANISRMKGRLAAITRSQAEKPTEQQGENIRLEDNPAENRVRLFFAGKPPVEVRSRLKSSGFRWAPSLGCWQAYRNDRAMETARREIGSEAVTV